MNQTLSNANNGKKVLYKANLCYYFRAFNCSARSQVFSPEEAWECLLYLQTWFCNCPKTAVVLKPASRRQIPALELPFTSCCLSQDCLPPSGLMFNKEKETKVAASYYVRKSDHPCLLRHTEALYKRQRRAIMFQPVAEKIQAGFHSPESWRC